MVCNVTLLLQCMPWRFFVREFSMVWLCWFCAVWRVCSGLVSELTKFELNEVDISVSGIHILWVMCGVSAFKGQNYNAIRATELCIWWLSWWKHPTWIFFCGLYLESSYPGSIVPLCCMPLQRRCKIQSLLCLLLHRRCWVLDGGVNIHSVYLWVSASE